jgi:hypothetical protein
MNIYEGKEPNCGEVMLGERVVKGLASTVQGKDVALAFSRFFNIRSFDGYPEFCISGDLVQK